MIMCWMYFLFTWASNNVPGAYSITLSLSRMQQVQQMIKVGNTVMGRSISLNRAEVDTQQHHKKQNIRFQKKYSKYAQQN